MTHGRTQATPTTQEPSHTTWWVAEATPAETQDWRSTEDSPVYPLPPTDTELGPLALRRTYDFYDHPQTFSCVGPGGRMYLAFHVEVPPRADIWLFVRVSALRLHELESGHRPACAALVEAEDGYVHRLVYDSTRSRASVDHLLAPAIPPEWLPEEGERLVPASEARRTRP